MNVKHPLFWLIFALFLPFWGCNNENTTTEKVASSLTTTQKPIIELPKTAEGVVTILEENVGKNEYEIPLMLCAGEALAVMATNADAYKVAVEKGQSDEVSTFTVEMVKCEKEANGKIICRSILKDESGKFGYKYELISDNGQWKVQSIKADMSLTEEQPAQ